MWLLFAATFQMVIGQAKKYFQAAMPAVAEFDQSKAEVDFWRQQQHTELSAVQLLPLSTR
jgi:hypothetical protein